MPNIEFNTSKVKRVPINRNNLFYSEKDFEYDIEVGKNYVEQDMNQTLILFEVDLEKSDLDAFYKESKSNGLVFKTPVEFHCVYELEQSELKSYDKTKNLGVYLKSGKLKFGVYQATLDELNADIKNGDYILLQVDEKTQEKFVVTNDGRNNFANKQSIYGYKPFYRECEAAPVSSMDEY